MRCCVPPPDQLLVWIQWWGLGFIATFSCGSDKGSALQHSHTDTASPVQHHGYIVSKENPSFPTHTVFSPNIYNISILHLKQFYNIKFVFSYKSSKNQITATPSYWGEYSPLHLTSHRTNLEALAFCREFLLLLAVAVSRSSLVFVPSNIEEY